MTRYLGLLSPLDPSIVIICHVVLSKLVLYQPLSWFAFCHALNFSLFLHPNFLLKSFSLLSFAFRMIVQLKRVVVSMQSFLLRVPSDHDGCVCLNPRAKCLLEKFISTSNEKEQGKNWFTNTQKH